MIDHQTRITAIIKQVISETSLTQGIDKAKAGFVVTPTGPVPLQSPEGGAMLVPCWIVTVTIQTDLIGQPPIQVPITIPGALPGDEEFRGATREAFQAAVKKRDEVMNVDVTVKA